MRKPFGRKYTATQFFWAVMYKDRISSLHPRGRDAQKEVNLSNTKWVQLGWRKEWSTKRFKFHFRGVEIDAYEHLFERKEV